MMPVMLCSRTGTCEHKLNSCSSHEGKIAEVGSKIAHG
jgi:hypothetical protein